MLLTVSKRLEFCASRRLYVKSWSDAENLAAFGPESSARYGTGRNYVAYFGFSGAVDPTNGMLMNISEMKRRIGVIVHNEFDHKFLNEDNPAFAEFPPTAENIARELFRRVAPVFGDSRAKLVVCHLEEKDDLSATFYDNGLGEVNHWLSFSAARQTMSPRLSDKENEQLFGIASSKHGHGHHYRARLTLRREKTDPIMPVVFSRDIEQAKASLHRELDHRNLNHEVPGLADQPITTENLAAYVFRRVAGELPLHRVRLHERPDFFAEYWSDEKYYLGLQSTFSAAHRLESVELSAQTNTELYGKCNNPAGHGHLYRTEATVGGQYDERSGTLYNFTALNNAANAALEPWQNKHLDLETEDFRDKPSTGENIVQTLWPKFSSRLNDRLVRLRLWETANNRFTLR